MKLSERAGRWREAKSLSRSCRNGLRIVEQGGQCGGWPPVAVQSDSFQPLLTSLEKSCRMMPSRFAWPFWRRGSDPAELNRVWRQNRSLERDDGLFEHFEFGLPWNRRFAHGLEDHFLVWRVVVSRGQARRAGLSIFPVSQILR